jgi:hypothetical protein
MSINTTSFMNNHGAKPFDKAAAMAQHAAQGKGGKAEFDFHGTGPNALKGHLRGDLCTTMANLKADAGLNQMLDALRDQLRYMCERASAPQMAGAQTEGIGLHVAKMRAELPSWEKTRANIAAIQTLMGNLLPGQGRNNEATRELNQAFYPLAKYIVKMSPNSKTRPKTEEEIKAGKAQKAQKARDLRERKKAEQAASAILKLNNIVEE